MFRSRTKLYVNGLDTLKVEARRTRELRNHATRELVRELEELKRQRQGKELMDLADRARKSGAY